jgi:protoporphyrinogen oxidase
MEHTKGNTHETVAVIGAGPAGMTAAYQLAKGGAPVDLYEASASVGGLSRTIELWGQLVDLGPHRFFSSDARINRFWLEVVGRDYQMVDRLTRIFYKGKFFHYPLKPFDVLPKLGPLEIARCGLSYARQSLKPAAGGGSFEDWVVRAFGRRLFQIFFQTYSEKLWGISCRELDADFAAQRIKKLSFYEAVKSAFLADRKQQHKTLVDRFAYPLRGTGMVYERMAAFLKSRGQNVFLNTPVRRVVTQNGRVQGIELEQGRFAAYSTVISTMPLTLLVKALPDVPAAIRAAADQLRFRNTILVYLNVDGEALFPDNWLYIHSPDIRTGRITNFRNWVPSLNRGRKTTILALEYWCYGEDEIWSQDDKDLVTLASRELRQTGLIGSSAILDGFVHRVNRCYPVYSIGYKQKLAPIQNCLSAVPGLSVIGRYGSFKYNNQDHSILMGLLAAENILQGAGHDLWSINTDYEAYQESATITESGLQPA